jgi:hypothetical protein
MTEDNHMDSRRLLEIPTDSDWPLYEGEICISLTERRGRVVNTPAAYSRGPGFTSRSGDRLSSLRFVVLFLSHYRQMMGLYLKIWPRPLLPHPFHFIIYLSPLHSTLYITYHRENVVK